MTQLLGNKLEACQRFIGDGQPKLGTPSLLTRAARWRSPKPHIGPPQTANIVYFLVDNLDYGGLADLFPAAAARLNALIETAVVVGDSVWGHDGSRALPRTRRGPFERQRLQNADSLCHHARIAVDQQLLEMVEAKDEDVVSRHQRFLEGEGARAGLCPRRPCTTRPSGGLDSPVSLDA